jgi:guanosine-3',5'-bis(diphosphate) 3'-pyrophosphohydrolase
MNLNMLGNAIAFASEKHSYQLDKGGNAYILHPLRMMMRLRTSDEELMAIAVLHDVVEDCEVSFDDLRDLGMSERVVAGVAALTRRAGETYTQFIERLADNRDALLVKREDLRDNSDLTRLKGVTEKDVARMQKYMNAFKRVEELLNT